MSNSKKKTPISGNTTKESEKKWKKEQHKKLRKKVKMLLQKRSEDLNIDLDVRDISNIYLGPKDGKSYWVDYDDKFIRK